MACMPRFDKTLGENMVNIYVGPLRKRFKVHEDLLCRDAPVFDAMFKGGFKEGLTKRANLPEDDPETFKAFIKWLSDDELDELEIDKEHMWAEPLLGRMKLFIFAEKYCIDVLADYSIDTILLASEHWGERDFTQPTLEFIQLVYENTSPGSGLRLYLASCSAICYAYCRWGPSDKEIDDYVMSRNAGHMHDIMKEYLADMAEQDADHPCLAAVCYYHRHGGWRHCFTRSREEVLLKAKAKAKAEAEAEAEAKARAKAKAKTRTKNNR